MSRAPRRLRWSVRGIGVAVSDEQTQIEHVDVVAHVHDERHVVLDDEHRQPVDSERSQKPPAFCGRGASISSKRMLCRFICT